MFADAAIRQLIKSDLRDLNSRRAANRQLRELANICSRVQVYVYVYRYTFTRAREKLAYKFLPYYDESIGRRDAARRKELR